MSNGRPKTASFGPSFLGVILLFCGFALVAWLLFSAAVPTQSYEDKRAQARKEKAAAIAKEAQDKLFAPAKWIDKAKGTVQLPIDTAMQLVVNDYQAKPVQPSAVKVEEPYPVGLGLAAPVAPAPATGNATAVANPATGATPAPAASPVQSSSPASATPVPAAKAAESDAATAGSPTPEVKK